MKIISYLLNKLNGFRIGIDEDGNAQLISYRNHPFTNTGGGAKRVEAFAIPLENNNLQIAQSKYDELNTGDVLVATTATHQGNRVTEVAVVASVPSVQNPSEYTKCAFNGQEIAPLTPAIPYPADCSVYKNGEVYGDSEFEEEHGRHSAVINQSPADPFTAAYDILFPLDATLVKLERCDGSFEPTEVVSGATLVVKTVEEVGITCPCLSFSDNVTSEITTYRYKATTSDGEINFSISYQGVA